MARKVLIPLLFGGQGAGNWAGEVGLLALRLWTGFAIALGHGWGKISDPQAFIDNLPAAFPAAPVMGWMAILGEFVGGILLCVGLFTRPAALWIMSVMAGAAFVAHAEGPLFLSSGQGAKELALLFFFPALCFLLTGSGRTGLDQFPRRKA